MTLSTKHKFKSAKADGTDVTLVKPSNWNDDHNLTTDAVAGGVILGRAEGAGPGPITDMPFSNVLPAGIMLPFAGATVPGGWLLCDGRQVLRSDYPNLFAAISTTWNTGTVDNLHFCVPDMRGRTAAGIDAGAGRLTGFNALAATGGAQSTTATIPQMAIGVSIEGGYTTGTQSVHVYMTTDGGNQSLYGGIVGGGDVAHGSHTHYVDGWFNTGGEALSTHGSWTVYNNAGYATGTIATVQPTAAVNFIIRT